MSTLSPSTESDLNSNTTEPQILSDFEDVATVRVFAAKAEHAESHSAEIAAMYEAALGKDGVGGEGHEAYPDSDLFSAEGIKSTLQAGERIIAVAQIKEDGQDVIVGAMVADHMSPHHVEFNSMAVPLARRGLKLGSHIVRGLADIIDASKFTVNATELVTHSMASQAAHFHNGFRAICGFGFCHYPHVFFKDHPESVLWVTKFQGTLVPDLRKFRSALGRQLGRHLADVKQKLIHGQASGQVNLASGRLDDESLNLVSEVLKERSAFVPQRYHNLVEAILFQFEDILDVSVKSYVRPDLASDEATAVASDNKTENLTFEPKDGFGHSYIIFKRDFTFDENEVKAALEAVHKMDKRYIKVCIPANTPEAIKAADYLNGQGFVFHSFLPLYGYGSENNSPEFYDILSLQWIAPTVLQKNPLPGETNSVVKLYGYPENLSGSVVKMIAGELNQLAKNNSQKELGQS